MPTPEETIEENLAAPKQVTIGNQTVVGNTLPEQIAAAEFLANQQAKAGRSFPVRLFKVKADGAI